MSVISLEIGLASRSEACPPPKCRACASPMKDQVMASTSPRVASVRLAVRTRFWLAVRTARVTPPSRGSGVKGMRSAPESRTTSSTRSAAPWMSGRQEGVVTVSEGACPCNRDSRAS